MSKLILGVAGGMLMVCLMSDSQAAEVVDVENAFVKVSADTPVYRLEQKGEKDFNAYCSSNAPATFSVASQSTNWVLVAPASGSLAVTPGTSGVWKVKSQLGEDKPDGRIYLWNYFIEADGYNAKDITVPFGKEVKYFSYEGPNVVNSDWDVSGYEKSKQKSDTDSIIFSRSFWDITEWFTESYSTPQPGVYEIKAHLTGKPNANDTGKMTVVNTDFKDSTDHPYGFDDYTEWDLGPTDYYSSTKKGRCKWPYASVKAGASGKSELWVTPASNTRPIPIQPSASALTCSPMSVVTTKTIQFGLTEGDGILKTKIDDVIMSELNVTAYNEKTYKCAIIAVQEETNSLITPTLPNAMEYETACCAVFKQAVVKFTCDGYSHCESQELPSRWTLANRYQIVTNFLNSYEGSLDADIYVFLIPGKDAIDPDIAGLANQSKKYVFIFSGHFNSPPIYNHEIGHCLKLGEEYNPITKKRGPDLSNVMNIVNGIRLRKSQWDIIQGNL